MQLKQSLLFVALIGALAGCPSGDDRGSGSQNGEATGGGGDTTRDGGSSSMTTGGDMLGGGGNSGASGSGSTGTQAHDAGSATSGSDAGTAISNDAGMSSGGGSGRGGASGSTLACPLGRWSQKVTGAGTCDGTEGEVAFVITEGTGGSVNVAEELTNIQTGPACDWEFDGTATFQDGTLEVDLVRDDNGCEKHILITFTVDDACQVLSTNGDAADVNCESCNPGCMGCGTETCTSNYGPGMFDRE
jgi:hypothetical protein